MVAWAVALVASPAMPLARTGLEVMPTRPCTLHSSEYTDRADTEHGCTHETFHAFN